MNNDKSVHENGCYTSEDRASVSRIVDLIITKKFADQLCDSDEVDDLIQKTINDLIN